MGKRLDKILLIDDNEADNFYHRIIIEEADCAEQIDDVENGESALEYLTTKVNGAYPTPDLIFLDINMPRMNGWEFIEAYRKLPKEARKETVVVMLTTSMNIDDEELAASIKCINAFKNKPLTPEILNNILVTFFM